MPYVPPNGSAVDLEFGGSYTPPRGASVNLEFDTPVGDVRQAGVGDSARLGTPGVRRSGVLRASGTDTSAFGRLSIQRDVPRIYPPSIDSTAVVGTPEYVRWRRFIDVPGMAEPSWPLGDGRVRLLGGYNPPPAVNVISTGWTSRTPSRRRPTSSSSSVRSAPAASSARRCSISSLSAAIR